MVFAGGKGKAFLKSGAGGWALLAALLLLCVLFVSSRRDEGNVKTDMEIRMERIIQKLAGAGDVYVMINEEDGAVTGVLIVCEGADDIRVRLRVQDAARALLNIDNERIHVVPMEEAGR